MKPIEDIFGKHFRSDEVLTMLIELHAKVLAGMPCVLRWTRYKYVQIFKWKELIGHVVSR